MAQSGKDRVAREVADLRITFDSAVSNKRKYPVAEFNAFVQSARRYIKITATDPMIHKERSAGSERTEGVLRSGTKADSGKYLV
jgi:hypothetical protein